MVDREERIKAKENKTVEKHGEREKGESGICSGASGCTQVLLRGKKLHKRAGPKEREETDDDAESENEEESAF